MKISHRQEWSNTNIIISCIYRYRIRVVVVNLHVFSFLTFVIIITCYTDWLSRVKTQRNKHFYKLSQIHWSLCSCFLFSLFPPLLITVLHNQLHYYYTYNNICCHKVYIAMFYFQNINQIASYKINIYERKEFFYSILVMFTNWSTMQPRGSVENFLFC